MRSLILGILISAAAGLLLGNAAAGLTAANTVPSSHAGVVTDTITPNKLKPAACSALTLTHLSVGSGNITGTSANDLILGSASNDTLGSNTAGQGTDCCLGGGGANTYKSSCTVHFP